MKLRDVTAGKEFAYPNHAGRFLKLKNNNLLPPPETCPNLTELAAEFYTGRVLHCNPEDEVNIL